jgi:prophage tail gpP-like protein
MPLDDTKAPDASITLDDVKTEAKADTSPIVGGNNLSLIVNDTKWEGWQRVAVTRSMDTIPASFDVQVTERYERTNIEIKPGDPCKVMIGGDLVITGYIDRYAASVNPQDHTVRISGRSKSADLVDCAAFIGDKDNPTYQVKEGTTLSIAQALAKPYGITIKSLNGEGIKIPQFNINLGETAWEIIDRITRFSQLIAYDMPDGSMVLAQAGTEKMASGFVQGVNIEQGSVNFSMDQRFSEYEGFLTSQMAYFVDAGHPPMRGVIVKDEGVPRYRKHIIISEQTFMGEPVIKARVIWEMNRRKGRSQAVTIIADNWRDSKGALWAPNHLAPIKLPTLKLPSADWCIGQVSYTRDELGQHATVVMMPKEAFLPDPTPPQFLPPLVADVERHNATAKPAAATSSPSIGTTTTEQIIDKGAT